MSMLMSYQYSCFPYGGLDEVISTYLLPTRNDMTLDSAKLPVLAPCLSHIRLPMIEHDLVTSTSPIVLII